MVAKLSGIQSKNIQCEWSESSESPVCVNDLYTWYEECREHPLFVGKLESQAGVFWIETECFRCGELTELLCSLDDYDQIVKIDGEYYLLSVNSQTNQLEINWINSQEFVLDWTVHNVGVAMTDEQIKDLQSELESELKGITVCYKESLWASTTDFFTDKVDDIFWKCVQQVLN